MQKLTRHDLHDILHGCTILGTGRGGKLDKGLSLIDKALDAGKEFILVGLNEVPDYALIACPYMCGSISPLTEEEERKYAGLPRTSEEQPLRAFKALEEYLGKEFYGLISTELVDADPAGRSVPELPAPKEWRTEKGLQVFGPKHFGYDIEYLPIVEKVS